MQTGGDCRRKGRIAVKKGILFDLDGTLWDSSQECVDAWNECIRTKTDRTEQFSLADMRGFMGKTMEAIAALMFPSLPTAEQLRILRLCTEEEHSYILAHKPRLYDGEADVLRALSQEYALGVVSNCQDGYIQLYLHHCGFSELFCDFECAGRTGKTKGQNIRLVMERQNLDWCCYVGDTQGDCDAAKEAGVPFLHAAYGFGTADKTDAVLSDLRDLPRIMKQF